MGLDMDVGGDGRECGSVACGATPINADLQAAARWNSVNSTNSDKLMTSDDRDRGRTIQRNSALPA
jgi:hypothetical protein